jgi:hypothetical protein
MVCSAVVELPTDGCQILLNADNARSMRVEITDVEFKPLPGFSGSDSGYLQTDDGLDCVVKWPQVDVASLGGKKVRLLVHLKKTAAEQPRLYAVSVQTKGTQP